MRYMELLMRQNADTAREALREERRKAENKSIRNQINVLILIGLDRNEAVNFALDKKIIPIIEKKEIRKAFHYGCHAICSMAEELSDIKHRNSSELVLEGI